MMNDNPQHPVTNPAPNSSPQSKPLLPRSRGRVFDVMRPGKAPASATSRPVVIGHKTGAQASQINVSGVGERSNLLDPHHRDVQPMHHIDVPSAADHHVPITMTSHRPAIAEHPTAPAPEHPDHTLELAAPMPTEADEAPQPEHAAIQATPAQVEALKAASEPESEITMPGMIADKLTEAALEAEAPPPPPTPERPMPPAHDPLQDEAVPVAAPQLEHQPVVVSHHLRDPGSVWRMVGLLLLILLLLAIVADILMDTGLIPSGGIPHTVFFG
jgi:hypothetical protein